MIFSGNILAGLHPDIDFSKYAINGTIIISSLKVFVASLFILILQFVISYNFKNFIIPIGTGVIGTVGTSMLLSWQHSDLIPYALPMLAAQGLYKMELTFFTGVVIYSIIGSAIIFITGLCLVNKKNVL